MRGASKDMSIASRFGLASRTVVAAAITTLLSVGLLSLSTPALATEVHVYSSTFGSPGSAPEELDKPLGIAVNSSTDAMAEPAAGDVYVVDSANNRVERFSETGVYLGQFNGSGTYEVIEGAVAKTEHGTPAPTGAFSEPTEIAVDNSGNPISDPSAADVYVIDSRHGVIDKFSATGAYLGQLPGVANPGGLEGVAVDTNGTVWVSIRAGAIYSFSDALENKYATERNTDFGPGMGLGVDANDDLYFRNGRTITEVNSAGETLANPFGEDTGAFERRCGCKW